jgi:peptidyl-dipeptidase Dcp
LHYETNEVIPDELLDRLMKARSFNQGFESVEYTASALVDQALHSAPAKGLDIAAFEAAELARLGMPQGIVMRHRPAHFSHLFSGASYAAGYYVYLWAEVLDADGFDAFLETGNPFDPETARRLRQFVYSSGNSIEPGFAFRSFRGRCVPSIQTTWTDVLSLFFWSVGSHHSSVC